MLILEKGKALPEGTIKEWKGKKYKKTGGKWLPYKGGKEKKKEKKFKIKDFYGAGRHKYFKNKSDLDDFNKRLSEGKIGGKLGRKIKSTSGRISQGTKVQFVIRGKKKEGKIVGSDGTSSKSPTKFDIQHKEKGKVIIKKDVPREQVKRLTISWSQKKEEKKKLTIRQRQQENVALLMKDADKKIQQKSHDLVMANWDMFSKMVGKYYTKRSLGGFDASKFGFDEDDLRQEVYLVVQRAATSFLTNPPKDKRATFISYVRSFLKANMAAALMAGSGSGGHMKASQKDQLYIWFFKDTLDEYKKKHKRLPSDVEMLDMLEKKRKGLPNEKGNKTIRDYKWTIDKIRNKKKQTKIMTSLDKNIQSSEGDSTTLLSILNEEELEKIPGRYKLDPWQEVKKVVVRDGVREALKRVLKSPVDREIIIRSYGLFIDENSPQKMRIYAQGQTSSEIARFLNGWEEKRGSKKRWSSNMIDNKIEKILRTLREDPTLKRNLGDFVKSEQKEEWSDVDLVMEWIAAYGAISEAIDNIIPEQKVTVVKESHKAIKPVIRRGNI